MTDTGRLLLLGCGILKKEVAWLIEKNGWPMDTVFFGAALHNEFDKLSNSLTHALDKYRDRETIVFYGACHPLMDTMLDHAHTFRTEGQNCVEMVLGREVFQREVEGGAYFLLEDWAVHWRHVTDAAFGHRREVMREIFQMDRSSMLAMTTPCSGDFSAAARDASEEVGLPLRWMDVSLDHLEAVLRAAVTRKLGERP